MHRHTSPLARLVLLGASLVFFTASATAEPPQPRPKPAIVVDHEVRIEEATAPPPRPVVVAPVRDAAAEARLEDAASIVWSIYRLTWLLAAIGLGVIALSVWQAFAARDATRRRLRAYVAVRAGMAPHLDTDWTDASVIVTNHGATPAFALDYAATLMMLDFPEMPLGEVMGAADKMFGKKSFVLAPGAELTLPLRTVLSEDEKHETEDGTHKRLVAIGEIRYADAFKKKHVTRFCFTYGGPAIIASGQMQIADLGNAAD
jgi:hypothetical protein